MFSLLIEWQEKLVTVALLYARITPIFFILPVLNTSVLASTFVRNSVIFAIIIGLWPVLDTNLPQFQTDYVVILAMIAKEIVIGISLGGVLSLPFWIFNALGAYIDVARGSSMGSLIDPTNGQESTEIQNFVNFCVCAIYLESGGLQLVLNTLINSYQTVGLKQGIQINLDMVVIFLGQLFEHGFILAAPVLLTLLLSEALLGLLARFTPQLSAFSVSMTIKSVIAIFVLSLYFWHMLPDQLPRFMVDYQSWHLIQAAGER